MKSKRIINSQWGLRGFLFFMLLGSFFQVVSQQTVTGMVTDASDGTTLPGVTIQVKGTQNGVATDIDGRYTISVSPQDVLVFTYIGYKTTERNVGNRTTIDVSLETEIQELSEIVVIGYGQVEKGDVTGVVNKVDEKQFNKGMLTSPEQLIAGKVAGVQVTQNSGEPGGGISVRIRGGSSLLGGNSPLYVVDGIPLNPDGVSGSRNALSFINPADIADITILKDASAAAIYGSRAASGVVIITTKSGKSGKPQFTYDGSVSVSSIVDRVDMLSTEEFVFTVERKGPRNLPLLGYNDQLYDTDWLDEILQTAIGHNHNLGASFGIKENTSARVSVNYQNLDGILKTSNTERIAGSVNLSHKMLNDDLTIKLNTKHSLINNRFAPNVVGTALIYAPTQPIRIDDGSFFQWTQPLAPSNPVSVIESTHNIGRSIRNLIGLNLDYKLPFVEGLSVNLNYALDRSDGLSQQVNYSLQRSSSDNGFFGYFEDYSESNLLEGYLKYEKEISFGKLDVMGGYSYQDFDRRRKVAYQKPDTLLIDDLNISDPLSYLSRGELEAYGNRLFVPQNTLDTDNRLISFWGRANLSIKDKYLITATLRRDGSSRFGPSNRWGLFPSAAIGWRIIDEPFMDEMTDIFSNLKVRVGYGITGNQEIGNFLYEPIYEFGDDRAQYIFGNDTINTVRPLAVDPDIKWEETESWNVGLDFGFMEGRLNGSIDLYKKVTSDLLLEITFPIGQLPGDRAVTNVAEFESKGFELMLNSVVIEQNDLKIDVSFNAAYNQNKILKLNKSAQSDEFGIQNGGISGDVGQTIQVLRVGQPNPAFLVYQRRRDSNGNPIPDGDDFNNDGSANDLDLYVDQNGDSTINESDLIAYKSPLPDWTFGLTTNVTYKKFDLAMTWRASLGNHVYNNVFSQYGTYDGTNNIFSPNNIHSIAYTYDFTERDEKQLLSDIYVEDASFVKLDNITLGYSFKANDLFDGRVYFTASNLLAISGYRGIDPEAGGLGGIDNNPYPRSRTYVLGVNLTF